MTKEKEVYHFRDMPTVTKVGEIPTGIYILRINLPLNLRHLAQKGVGKAFLRASTSKSVRTLLKEEILAIDTFREKIKQKVENTHPSLKKRVRIDINTRIMFGTHGTHSSSLTFVTNIPKLYKDMNELGLSDLPLRSFAIPLDQPQKLWATFEKKREAFICTQIGTQMYSDLSYEDLEALLATNKILRDLNAFVCETVEKEGRWLSCKVPHPQKEEAS